MRNKQLIQEIYEICMTADYRDEGHVVAEIIADKIEKERAAWTWLHGKEEVATGCDYGIGG